MTSTLLQQMKNISKHRVSQTPGFTGKQLTFGILDSCLGTGLFAALFFFLAFTFWSACFFRSRCLSLGPKCLGRPLGPVCWSLAIRSCSLFLPDRATALYAPVFAFFLAGGPLSLVSLRTLSAAALFRSRLSCLSFFFDKRKKHLKTIHCHHSSSKNNTKQEKPANDGLPVCLVLSCHKRKTEILILLSYHFTNLAWNNTKHCLLYDSK